MRPRPSYLDRLARTLMRHAAGALSGGRAPWAAAMQAEFDQIESGWERLTWAAGCVVAGYTERSRLADVVGRRATRAVLAVLIAMQAMSMLFASVLTAAYRSGYINVAIFLGSFTPGDDYRRLIPLMNQVPWWLHLVWVVAAAGFALAAGLLLWNRPLAFPAFAAAAILGAAGDLYSRRLPAYAQAFSFRTPLFTRDVLIPTVSTLVPLLLAAALWIHSRRALGDAAL